MAGFIIKGGNFAMTVSRAESIMWPPQHSVLLKEI